MVPSVIYIISVCSIAVVLFVALWSLMPVEMSSDSKFKRVSVLVVIIGWLFHVLVPTGPLEELVTDIVALLAVVAVVACMISLTITHKMEPFLHWWRTGEDLTEPKE